MFGISGFVNKEEGYPRICILVKLKANGYKEIYFCTGNNSAKTAHYKANPKAGVTYYQGGDSVSLVGNIVCVEDTAAKESLWQDWFIKHLPGGKNDPNYAILKFEAVKATIYINDRFETVNL